MAETLRELYREQPQVLSAQRQPPTAAGALVPGSPMRVAASSPAHHHHVQSPQHMLVLQQAPAVPTYQLSAQPGIPPQLQLTPHQQVQYSYYIPQHAMLLQAPQLTYQPQPRY